MTRGSTANRAEGPAPLTASGAQRFADYGLTPIHRGSSSDSCFFGTLRRLKLVTTPVVIRET